MNSAKVFLLMVALMAIFSGVGYMFGGTNGLIMALVLAIGFNFFSYWYSDKMVLKMYRAREVTEAEHPRLYGIVSRISKLAMMPMPKVYIIPTKAPNAFATGRNAEHAAVAATEGLLEILNDDELEGVMGHEIAHVQNRDMLIGTIAATFVGAIGILASMARWGAIFGGYSRDNERGGGFALIVTAIIAPLIAVIIQMAISRQREFKADAAGGKLTGKYLGLASALEKLHRSPVKLNLDSKPGTASLMIANPISGRGLSSLFSTHPKVEDRIERLKTLSTEAVYQGL